MSVQRLTQEEIETETLQGVSKVNSKGYAEMIFEIFENKKIVDQSLEFYPPD